MTGRGRATAAPIMPAPAGGAQSGPVSLQVHETCWRRAAPTVRMGAVDPRRRAAALLLATGLGLGLAACGGDDDGSAGAGDATTAPPATTAPAPAPAPKPKPRPEALAGLPAFTAGFQRWDRLNAEPIPPDSPQTRRVGFDAHRGTKDVYVSVPRAADPRRRVPGGHDPGEGGPHRRRDHARRDHAQDPGSTRPATGSSWSTSAPARTPPSRRAALADRRDLLGLPPDRRGHRLGLPAPRPLTGKKGETKNTHARRARRCRASAGR